MFNRECIFSLIPAYFSGGFPHCSAAKNPPANVGDTGHMASVPRLGGSPGEEMATQSTHLAWGNPMDRGAWQATVHGVIKESDMN